GDVDQRLELRLEVRVAVDEPVREDVGHRHELGRAALVDERVPDGAGPAPAAADEGQLNRIAALSEDVLRQSHSGQRAGGGDAAGGLQQFAAGEAYVGVAVLRRVAHGDAPVGWLVARPFRGSERRADRTSRNAPVAGKNPSNPGRNHSTRTGWPLQKSGVE